jgi:hypothetical protein
MKRLLPTTILRAFYEKCFHTNSSYRGLNRCLDSIAALECRSVLHDMWRAG